ncbi:hypothetical protein COCSUDRAFT_59735 [Coccomyxa subellipsoidea C-169]|uniref:Uncharacterized protein n=1 Tax=Coccomyxa subellipsoidea (strain C-169) TaxID=574566 RepID=I0YK86_COCSC|nr:hypothetical protein COCSUDRAFT_59735 [Coccomyxa subellipsoidea C-169]EIE18805.1 hypothetical protein COCSUDRAFT_59735 [Coccomyxa subellipsoidea C-169]|eukprot:XP_005643349.1 hypothetical protein COCSUDRAFT_59735 [Coccomyxa subellipsoidea C-169]
MQARPLVQQMLRAFMAQHAATPGQPACLTLEYLRTLELEDAKAWQNFTAARTASGVIHSRLHTSATRTSTFVTVRQMEQPKKEGIFVARTQAVQRERVALDLHSLSAARVTAKVGNGRLFGVPHYSQSRPFKGASAQPCIATVLPVR